MNPAVAAMALGVTVGSLLGAPTRPARAEVGDEASDRERLEEALFGGDEVSDRERLEDALFGGDEGDHGDDGAPGRPAAPASARDFDPLSLGGQMYLRTTGSISDRGPLGEQRFAMPNLLDVYLDARPEDRVRAFVQGRLRFDPTIAAGGTDLLGQPAQRASVILDQLWLKTDIARTVFITAGQERIKWGSSRLWNPTDYVNNERRDPVVFFDERVGVPMLKFHVPWETMNFYAIMLIGGAGRFDDVGAAFRAEVAFPSIEISASGVGGAGRKTAFGLDISAALGPIDITLEGALIDERQTLRYSGELDFERPSIPTGTPDGRWRPSISASVLYSAPVFDNDILTIGAEYFWNPGGTDRPDLYPLQLLTGSLEPFYLGQHYAALFILLPSPGTWDRMTFNLSGLGNLSDRSFIVRFDTIATLHTRLRLEAFVQGHLGTRGGEFRFALDVPEIPPIPGIIDEGVPAFAVPAPVLSAGLNLRVTL